MISDILYTFLFFFFFAPQSSSRVFDYVYGNERYFDSDDRTEENIDYFSAWIFPMHIRDIQLLMPRKYKKKLLRILG